MSSDCLKVINDIVRMIYVYMFIVILSDIRSRDLSSL